MSIYDIGTSAVRLRRRRSNSLVSVDKSSGRYLACIGEFSRRHKSEFGMEQGQSFIRWLLLGTRATWNSSAQERARSGLPANFLLENTRKRYLSRAYTCFLLF